MASQLPIKIQEHLQLQRLGISAAAIGFSTLTMESDHFICVREKQGDDCIIVIDLYDEPVTPIREPIIAESAIMNPSNRFIGLKAQRVLKILDLGSRCELKSHQMDEDVSFWRWVNTNTIAVVTEATVYHWSCEGDSAPLKMFSIHANLAGSQIINYHTDASAKWLLLIGISAAQNNRAAGVMQLYSVDRQVSQPLEGHAAVFVQHLLESNNNSMPSNLLAFAVRPAGTTGNTGKLQITELGSPAASSEHRPYQKKTVDITFSSDVTNDFPVAVQASEKYGMLFIITKFGFLYLYEIETAQCICANRFSTDPIFVTAPYTKTSGVIAVNRKGQVSSVSVDENSIVPFIASQLNNSDLAVRFALRNKLVAADDLYIHRFNELFQQGKYQEAAMIAARAPRDILRSAHSIQRFQGASQQVQQHSSVSDQLSAASGFMTSLFAGVQKAVKQQTLTPTTASSLSPVLQYFEVLLANNKLTAEESLEFGRAALTQSPKQVSLFEKWLNKDRIECSEQLGDLVKQNADTKLAQQVYLRAFVPQKVVQCLAETGQFQDIIQYAEKNHFAPDYEETLRNLLQENLSGVDFARWLLQKQLGIDARRIADVFMQQNLVKQCTAFLLDALDLHGDRVEDADLQTSLLEINLRSTVPQVAEAILSSKKYTHFDRDRIAELCKEAGLMQRYEELARSTQKAEPVMIENDDTNNSIGHKRPHDSLDLEESYDAIDNVSSNNADADLPSIINSVGQLINKMTQKTEQHQNDRFVLPPELPDAVDVRGDFDALLGALDQLTESYRVRETELKVEFEQNQQRQNEADSVMKTENLRLMQLVNELENDGAQKQQTITELQLATPSDSVSVEAEKFITQLQATIQEQNLTMERQGQAYSQQLSSAIEDQKQTTAQQLAASNKSWQHQQSELEQQLDSKTREMELLQSSCDTFQKQANELQNQLQAQTTALQAMQLESANRKDDAVAQQQQQQLISRLQAECERLKLHLSEQEQSYSTEFSTCEARESQLHEQLQIAARRNDELSARMAQALHDRAQLSTNNTSQLSDLTAAMAQANERRVQSDERCAQLQTSLEQLQIALHQIQREHTQALAGEREHAQHVQSEKDALASQYETKRIECDEALQRVEQVLKSGEDREILMKTYEQKLKMLAPLLAERDMVIDDLQSSLARHTGKPYQPQHSRLRRQESKDSTNASSNFDAGVDRNSVAAADLCDKSVVRDMLYKYCTSPKKYQPDMLALLCNVLGFNAQQRADMLKGIPNSSDGSGSWLPRLPFTGGGGGSGAANHSLPAEFVKYLLEQSESGGGASTTNDAIGSKKLQDINNTTTDALGSNGVPTALNFAPQGLLLTAASVDTNPVIIDSKSNGI